jgi:hypothetical protein
VPAVVAGVATTEWGLESTGLVYAAAVVVLALAALVAYRRVSAGAPVARARGAG